MIICLTGLIGSGKTTYAYNNMEDDHELIDYDKVVKECKPKHNAMAKQIILDLLQDAIKDDETITWFVCTIPDSNEQLLLDQADVKYLWLHNDIPTTISNLKRRGKYSDMENLELIYLKNVEILSNSAKFIMKYNAEVI